jgi:predicted transcriptional regulator
VIGRPGDALTSFRATLFFVSDSQNITLSLPRELLKRIKRLATDRDTSVSALLTDTLTDLANEDRRYSAARRRGLAALRAARSLGSEGKAGWSRDELHER